MPTSTDPCVRQDLLWRLRWDVSKPVEAEISAGPYDQTTNVPILGHPLADELLFDPPLSCIEAVHISDFGDKEDRDIYYPKEERYQPPAPLKIENKNGNAITLYQFVTEVHAYVGRNMQELKKVKGEMYGEEVTRADGSRQRDIIFGQPAINRDDEVWVTVKLYADGEASYPNGFWAPRLLQVRDYEARR
ncbi:hypothetical protein HBH70_232640 [Parastagonospora nodorum]|nr:hypothetical protein HBI03_231110 [Parastagonospora nodorum]KAH4256603.1 hypothetical protein HBI04_227970 [Parastagonospora nodorum]KAH5127362.1 hypothetical protein HBH70_232640 [Parastagonospora nodorum]KAH5168669.1 hypothetical protein HBH68_226810 [Parastagonospora nodorum]KAH5327461.1 hypothetical protein HBI50_072820 [Parastagonospora nodorum]